MYFLYSVPFSIYNETLSTDQVIDLSNCDDSSVSSIYVVASSNDVLSWSYLSNVTIGEINPLEDICNARYVLI